MAVKLDVMQFLKYDYVRRTGIYNMITEASEVANLIEVSPEQYRYIINNYDRLFEESCDFLAQHDGVLSKIGEELCERAEEICRSDCEALQAVFSNK